MVLLNTPENFLYYLSAHKDCSDSIMRFASGLNARDLELASDRKTLHVRKMVCSVMAETYRMRGFVRLKPLGNGILYGYLKPIHRIGERTCDFFARRSPSTIVALGNSHESWISLYTGHEIFRFHGPSLDSTLRELEAALGCDGDGSEIERIWEAYYSSQYCPERRNIRAFHSRMPESSLDSAGLSLERNKNGCTLRDFFGD